MNVIINVRMNRRVYGGELGLQTDPGFLHYERPISPHDHGASS